MRTNRSLRVFTLMLAMACFVTSSNNFAFSSGTPKDVFVRESPDETDELVQAARAAVAVLNDSLRLKSNEIKGVRSELAKRVNELEAALSEAKPLLNPVTIPTRQSSDISENEAAIRTAGEKALAAIQSAADARKRAEENDYAIRNVEGLLQGIPVLNAQKEAVVAFESVIFEYQKLLTELSRVKERSEEENKQVAEKIARLVAIKKTFREASEILRERNDFSKLQDLLTSQADLENAKKCVSPISQDKAYAAKLLAAAGSHINNPSGLTQLLIKDSPCSNIDVREVKDVNGLMVIFRIGKLTHCLSTKLQCAGKPYSVTK